jgi:hypothetical protein
VFFGPFSSNRVRPSPLYGLHREGKKRKEKKKKRNRGPNLGAPSLEDRTLQSGEASKSKATAPRLVMDIL